MDKKPIRIPDAWRFLRIGEMTSSRLPLHRIEAICEHMAQDGYRFALTPSPGGYWVTCEARPPIDPDAEFRYAIGG
jgi:hypothetical protein